jgi:hypothetical protein
MRFCQEHWTKLKALLDDRGLTRFIADGGKEAVRRLVSGLEAADDAKSFEPLMGAHNAIVANAMDAVWLEVMAPNDDSSDRCPVCFLKTICKCGDPTCPERYEGWLTHAADDALARAKELGLVATA